MEQRQPWWNGSPLPDQSRRRSESRSTFPLFLKKQNSLCQQICFSFPLLTREKCWTKCCAWCALAPVRLGLQVKQKHWQSGECHAGFRELAYFGVVVEVKLESFAPVSVLKPPSTRFNKIKAEARNFSSTWKNLRGQDTLQSPSLVCLIRSCAAWSDAFESARAHTGNPPPAEGWCFGVKVCWHEKKLLVKLYFHFNKTSWFHVPFFFKLCFDTNKKKVTRNVQTSKYDTEIFFIIHVTVCYLTVLQVDIKWIIQKGFFEAQSCLLFDNGRSYYLCGRQRLYTYSFFFNSYFIYYYFILNKAAWHCQIWADYLSLQEKKTHTEKKNIIHLIATIKI